MFRAGSVSLGEHAPPVDLPTGAIAGQPVDFSFDRDALVAVVAYAEGLAWMPLDGSTPGHWMTSALRPSRVAVHGSRVAITSAETVMVLDEKGHTEWRGVPGLGHPYFAWPGEPGIVQVIGCDPGSLVADPELVALQLDYSTGDARVAGKSLLPQVTSIEAVASAGGVGFVAGSLERVRRGVSRADLAPADTSFVMLRIDQNLKITEVVRSREDLHLHVSTIVPSTACVAVVFNDRVVRVYAPVSASAYGLRFQKTFDRAVTVAWQLDPVLLVRGGEEILQSVDLRDIGQKL